MVGVDQLLRCSSICGLLTSFSTNSAIPYCAAATLVDLPDMADIVCATTPFLVGLMLDPTSGGGALLSVTAAPSAQPSVLTIAGRSSTTRVGFSGSGGSGAFGGDSNGPSDSVSSGQFTVADATNVVASTRAVISTATSSAQTTASAALAQSTNIPVGLGFLGYLVVGLFFF
jgi:hypothetical protein